MARGRLEHTADIAAPPEVVAAFLADLVNYEALHPMLWSTMTVRPHAGGTRLHEQVDINAPRMLMKTVLRDGGSSHAAMWDNLRRYFEQ
ncbi:SRPBCC family protein [Mycolicibacter icosiumassiliensis]|uniref:SRPBCC family protein n=1 Tax=Mycolicibacter icosiumassiliensis TaxID=1792835 RepID=UPI00082EEAE0|nr:SRPBCC family protein [Mycolicibacter icosiumassiliensis]